MIAVDTSTFIAFLAGESGRDVEVLDQALATNQAHLPPVVVAEIFSAPNAPASLERLIMALPILASTPDPGPWPEGAARRRSNLSVVSRSRHGHRHARRRFQTLRQALRPKAGVTDAKRCAAHWIPGTGTSCYGLVHGAVRTSTQSDLAGTLSQQEGSI